MGGNALKNCFTRRYAAPEFAILAAEILDRLRRDFPGRRCALLPAYRRKADFGDMDILVETVTPEKARDPWSGDLRSWAMETWTPAEIVTNGNVISFECQALQIDLVHQAPENFDIALAYYAWNDLGNLLGRVAHKMGTRFGHDGLSIDIREGNHKFARLVVSRDIDRILQFLGYDATRWSQGFDTLEDIFRFAASSPYFNRDIYAHDNRNHRSRTRDQKRANYRGFLEWLETQGDLPAYPWPSSQEIGGRRLDEEALARLFAAFPEREPDYRALVEDLAVWRQAKGLFNGQRVSMLTGLTGPALGQFMRFLRDDRPAAEDDATFHRWVLSQGDIGLTTWIEDRFMDWEHLNQPPSFPIP